MEHPDDPDRLACLDAERHDVLDFEVHRVADPHAVAQTVLSHFDRRALDARFSPISGASPAIGPPSAPLNTAASLSACSSDALSVDEQADAPVALRHDLRRVGDKRDNKPADVGSLHVARGDVEDERDAAPVVIGAVREGEVARAEKLARARLEVGPLTFGVLPLGRGQHGGNAPILRRL